MKRIRYVKTPEGNWVSLQTISGSNGDYKTMISADGKTGAVISADGSVVKTVTGTSAHKTKIAVKVQLESLGVVFNREKRKPRVEKVVE